MVGSDEELINIFNTYFALTIKIKGLITDASKKEK